MKTKSLFMILSILAPIGAFASGPGETKPEGTQYLSGSKMTYELFESAVLHSDLEKCPHEFDPEEVFCRITIVEDQANIWVFDYEEDQRLLAVKPYPLDGDFLPF